MEDRTLSEEPPVEINYTETGKARNPFLTSIHGNITYDFFYRSAIDTPYVDNDVVQHTLTTNIYATIKNTLPVIIQLNARQSNSFLFKNYIDANIQFDGHSYQSLMKHKLKERITRSLTEQSAIHTLEESIREKYQERRQLESWLQNGKQIQRLIESRQTLSQSFPTLDLNQVVSGDQVKYRILDSLNQAARAGELMEKYQGAYNQWEAAGHISSSITSFGKTGSLNVREHVNMEKLQEAIGFLKEYGKRNERYNSYREKINQLEEKYSTIKMETRLKLDSLKQAVDEVNDPEILKEQLRQYQLDTIKGFKWMKHLMAVQWLSIGRSNVDFSELTAKNISLTGVNIAYQSRIYLAAAAGTIDYRYRDFIVRPPLKIPQHLMLVRAGIGKQDASGFIFTLYRGKKEASWRNSGNNPGVNNVTGLAVEGRYRIGQHNTVIAEVAKSTYPVFLPTQNNSPGNSKLLGFSDRSNEAYSVQLFSYIPATDTRLTGMYKKLGINFQSFNVFNYNANYSAWAIRADQYFLKRKLFISGSIKTNEYNSPYTVYNYKSNTIFTTVQTTLRLKKWPVISAAYMPSSQLYKSGNEIIETRFNTLMASLSYMYKTGNIYMHSSAVHNRFFNDPDQQQFMYYNASGWMLNHSIIGNKLSLNSSASHSNNGDYRLLSLDQGISYSIRQWLRAGGGIKWSRLNGSGDSRGYYGNMQWRLNKLGEVHLSFDHGFLPGLNGMLLSNDMGRVLYIKTF